ncbi:Hypothetical predicted protein [Octopus vulgaris]|uniref:Uncharacterized protein n=1 Tax=Octopus vulgaris TaxID=6645 RepID=A0AA36F3F0_OCTVU|nr:Hypothetical predicted protein [Octopus vulgaris]
MRNTDDTENVLPSRDDAPVMVSKKNVCVKLMKDENPEMLPVRCVIHMSPVLNEVLKSAIKCISAISANAKCERLFKQLCENADYVRVLFDTEHATENDINIRHKGNEESDEQYSPPRGLIERLPSDQSTQRPEDTRNSIVPVKDSQENEKTTVTEDLAFAEEHRESIAEMRQKILNTLEVDELLKRLEQVAFISGESEENWAKLRNEADTAYKVTIDSLKRHH